MSSKDIKQKFRSLHSNLMNYAIMLTSNREEARELLEHTAAIAVERSDALPNDSMFKGWVFSMMRKVFAAEFESRSHSTAATVSAEVYAINLAIEAEHERPEGSHCSAVVTHALDALTDGYRKAINLYLSGHSVIEISTEMSLPVQVVKSRLAYCCNKLRIELYA